MTRTALTIAAALLAVLPFFGSAAEACISCEYVPPPALAAQQKSPSVERSAPRRERRREASEPRTRKSRVTETAKPEKVRKVEQADKVEKAETPSAEIENSSFALVTGAQPTVAAKTQTPGDRSGEHSTIATAAHQASDGAVEAANAGDSVGSASKAQGCSRYFPTVGQTIKVPCE